jgi:membrane protein implicated in regulation of membrane protease activity
MTKILQIFSLLVVCILILVFPIHINKIYDTILGRLLLIIVIIYFTLNCQTFGLLIVLSLIISLSLYFREGMENNTSSIENSVSSQDIDKIKVLTKEDADEDKEKEGIDRQSVEESVRPINSKELNNNKSILPKELQQEVMPNDEMVENFSSMCSSYN